MDGALFLTRGDYSMTAVCPTNDTGSFRLDAEIDFAAFREVLQRAGYSAAALKELTRGIKSADSLGAATLDRRTAAPTAFHTFARLFFLGLPVVEADFAAANAPLSIEPLCACGIVRAEGGWVQANARIERHGELFVCSDFVGFTHDAPIASDHVLGVGPTAISLAALTPRGSVESVLDLGTGGGIQALLAAQHAERVVATDICPRALNFAALNAQLNGLQNIELRSGSFFDPVRGERFERIVSNPPFVISPASRFIYRDGGLSGDAVSEHVTRGAAAHLEEGGYAVILLNWHHATDDDWSERPVSWTRDNGCDVRWMRFQEEDLLGYAAHWLRQEEKRDTLSAGRLLDEWVSYYKSQGIARISLGAVVMRKRTGDRNWLRCEDIPIDISLNQCGDQIERIFAGEDLLQEISDDRDLLERRFKLHPAHRVEQQLAARDGAWAIEGNKLHLTSGMDFSAQIDMPTMRFLAELDGTRTVKEAAAPIAEALDQRLEDVVPTCLDITKRMLRIGLLIRA